MKDSWLSTNTCTHTITTNLSLKLSVELWEQSSIRFSPLFQHCKTQTTKQAASIVYHRTTAKHEAISTQPHCTLTMNYCRKERGWHAIQAQESGPGKITLPGRTRLQQDNTTRSSIHRRSPNTQKRLWTKWSCAEPIKCLSRPLCFSNTEGN